MACHGRRRQQPGLRQSGQLGNGPFRPGRAVAAPDPVGAAQQGAPEHGIAVGEDHPGAAATGGQRRGEPGRSAADHEHVAVGVALVVARGIGQRRRPAEPGHVAQHRFPQRRPQRARVDEGLVVEAGRDERAEPAGKRAEIEGKARPGMLARRAEPVIELDLGGAAVGFAGGAGFELDERRGFLRPGRENPAPAVILEAARHQPDAVGEQRRCQRIARMALIDAPVKPEVEKPAAVDRAADGQAEGLGHGTPLRPGGVSPIW